MSEEINFMKRMMLPKMRDVIPNQRIEEIMKMTMMTMTSHDFQDREVYGGAGKDLSRDP
jgi:hypothetical protein